MKNVTRIYNPARVKVDPITRQLNLINKRLDLIERKSTDDTYSILACFISLNTWMSITSYSK